MQKADERIGKGSSHLINTPSSAFGTFSRKREKEKNILSGIMKESNHQQIIGIYGGSFDPIHNGHCRLIIELLEKMPFSEIKILPCLTPALKPETKVPADHRLNMLGLALLGINRVNIDERELKRAKVSYTYDSLQEIRNELGDKPLALIMGIDAFSDFDQWHRWQELLPLAHIIIVSRPHYELPQKTVLAELLKKHLVDDQNELCKTPGGKIFICPIPLLSISATDIRRKCEDNLSIKYLVPDSVLEYIINEELYTTE